MMGMPVNALIDLFTLAMPDLQEIGEREPELEISDPDDLYCLLNRAVFLHGSLDEKDLAAMHLQDFRALLFGGGR